MSKPVDRGAGDTDLDGPDVFHAFWLTVFFLFALFGAAGIVLSEDKPDVVMFSLATGLSAGMFLAEIVANWFRQGWRDANLALGRAVEIIEEYRRAE